MGDMLCHAMPCHGEASMVWGHIRGASVLVILFSFCLSDLVRLDLTRLSVVPVCGLSAFCVRVPQSFSSCFLFLLFGSASFVFVWAHGVSIHIT